MNGAKTIYQNAAVRRRLSAKTADACNWGSGSEGEMAPGLTSRDANHPEALSATGTPSFIDPIQITDSTTYAAPGNAAHRSASSPIDESPFSPDWD
ncbi:MAG: hypothetical protein ACLU38_04685 [Dysosmobacter sp.]